MKYRALWSQRPLSAIEEDDGEGGEEGERPPSRGTDASEDSLHGCPCKALTPYDYLRRPPSVLFGRGYVTSPEGGYSLSHTLNRIIDTATINIVGFEESFASHLNPESCSLMWTLCQVYGKTRMAIDLVERELIATKQEMEVAKHFFEDLSITENALFDGIAQTRSLREIAEMGVVKWRREYRRALDENTIIKLKANRYQLHLDKMESGCSDLSHQNYSVRAFLAICREKDKKQTMRHVRYSRLPVNHVSAETLVNGRYCNSPRRHCPKVNLSLPTPEETQSEPSLHRFPPGYRKRVTYYDRTIMQRITTSVFWTSGQYPSGEEVTQLDSLTSLDESHAHLPHFTGSAAVTPDIPSHLKKLVEIELSEAAAGFTTDAGSASKDLGMDEVGYVVIPEFEADDDEEERASVQYGESQRKPGSSEEAQDEKAGIQPSDTETAAPTVEEKSSSKEAEGPDPETDSRTFGEEAESCKQDRDDAEAPAEELSPCSSGSSDEISTAVRETVSSYLSGTGGVKDVESISNVIQNKTSSDTTLQNRAGCASRLSRPRLGTGSSQTPFIMARGIGLQREVSDQHASISTGSRYPFTTYRSQKLKKGRNPEAQRPATCSTLYCESSGTRTFAGPNPYSKDRASSVMNDRQVFLPPLPGSQTLNKHSGSISPISPISRESWPLVIKDRKPMTPLPVLGKPEKRVLKSTRVKSSGPKQTSEGLRAQVQSFTRQILPALSSTETPNTKFHQVLLIRSCSSEKMERPPLSKLNNDSFRPAEIRN